MKKKYVISPNGEVILLDNDGNVLAVLRKNPLRKPSQIKKIRKLLMKNRNV